MTQAMSFTYIDQLLKTATKGNVVATYATSTDRLLLGCKVCDMTLTTKCPEETTLDYGVQEFIKIHAHVGGHKDAPVPNCTCGGPKTGPEGTFGQLHHDWCPAYVYKKPPPWSSEGMVPKPAEYGFTAYGKNPAGGATLAGALALKQMAEKVMGAQLAGMSKEHLKLIKESMELQAAKMMQGLEDTENENRIKRDILRAALAGTEKPKSSLLKIRTGRKFR